VNFDTAEAFYRGPHHLIRAQFCLS